MLIEFLICVAGLIAVGWFGYYLTKDEQMDSKFIITLGVGLFVQAAGVIWWLAGLQASVQHNDFQIQMIAKDVSKNSKFVELWPAGRWGSGSLPSDVRQDLKIGSLETQVQKLNDKVFNGSGRK